MTREVNAAQDAAGTASRGPAGSLLSRTATVPGWLAVSMQLLLPLL